MLLAEQLVGEARERRRRRMSRRERMVTSASSVCFLAAAVALALLLPDNRQADPVLLAGLVAAYAIVSQVRFEFGGSYVSPEQLVYVPLLLLAPLSLVPLLVAVAGVAATIPQLAKGVWHRDRWFGCLGDSWSYIGPVLVLAALAPGEATLAAWDVYALALASQLLLDGAWTLMRDRLLDRHPTKEVVRSFVGTARVDAILSPVAMMVAIPAAQHPLALLAVFPLVWLLQEFAHDRQARYEGTLELHRAYRGTVALLSDVIEFDDPYTATHSRSITDLVQTVALEMGVKEADSQELEFAALLHDVGKISIPKEVLNKPAKLTNEEYELIKTHTLEGQFMLDRVGGLLARVGETVRSCHERWDGTGYPDGLVGAQIPLASRIVFCCDAFDAMTTDRVYRPAISTEAALDELVAHSGSQFDPDVVVALSGVIASREAVLPASDRIRALLVSNSGAFSQRVRASAAR